MAKHVKGKLVSKGQRKSSNKLNKRSVAIIARNEQVAAAQQAERTPNAMHQAFRNIKVAVHIKTSQVIDSVLKSFDNKSGNPKVGRGWTANLSPRTVKKLTKEGVFA